MKSRKFTLAIICLSICLGTFVFVSNVDARGLLRSKEICWQVVRDGELHFETCSHSHGKEAFSLKRLCDNG